MRAFYLLVWMGMTGCVIAHSYAEDMPPSRVKDDVITIDQATFAKADMALIHITPADGKITIPVSAVVWREDKPWVYAQKSAEHYGRLPITIVTAMPGGIYNVSGLPSGAMIVSRGAQLLLSEEFGGNFNPQHDDDDD